jgi:hypothetical protein
MIYSSRLDQISVLEFLNLEEFHLTAFQIFWLIFKWCSLFYVFGEVNFVTACVCVCVCVCVYFCVCGYDRDGICFSERCFLFVK